MNLPVKEDTKLYGEVRLLVPIPPYVDVGPPRPRWEVVNPPVGKLGDYRPRVEVADFALEIVAILYVHPRDAGDASVALMPPGSSDQYNSLYCKIVQLCSLQRVVSCTVSLLSMDSGGYVRSRSCSRVSLRRRGCPAWQIESWIEASKASLGSYTELCSPTDSSQAVRQSCT